MPKSLPDLNDVLGKLARKVLRPYQLAWVLQAINNPFSAVLGGRQLGKDFAFSFLLALLMLRPGSEWQVVSATQRHAQEFLRDVNRHLDLIFRVLKEIGYPLPRLISQSATELRTDWGSSVTSHAASARSVVGRRGSFLFNEVSAIPEAARIYESAYPIVTGARDNGADARMIMVGNASYRGSFWHGAWTGPSLESWAKSETTWSEAMRAMGRGSKWIQSRQSEIVESIGLQAFLQWYECQWRSLDGSFISPQALDLATYRKLPTGATEWPSTLGYDVGRVNDPSAFVRVLRGPSGERYALPGEVLHNTPYRVQRARLSDLIHARPTTRVLVDSTGNDDLATECQREHPGVVVPFKFSAQSKWGLFSALKDAIDAQELHIPAGDTELRIHLEGIEARPSPSGHIQVVLPRDIANKEKSGHHGDKAVALALANYCARSRGDGKVRLAKSDPIMPNLQWW